MKKKVIISVFVMLTFTSCHHELAQLFREEITVNCNEERVKLKKIKYSGKRRAKYVDSLNRGFDVGSKYLFSFYSEKGNEYNVFYIEYEYLVEKVDPISNKIIEHFCYYSGGNDELVRSDEICKLFYER